MRFKVMTKVVAAGLFLGTTSLAYAVSLSGAVVKSYIDEPLVIEAEVVDGGEVRLADPMDYLQYSHDIFHYDLKVDYYNKGGRQYIKLTTKEPVKDPSFIILLRARSTLNEPKMLELPIILDFKTGEGSVEISPAEAGVIQEVIEIKKQVQEGNDNFENKNNLVTPLQNVEPIEVLDQTVIKDPSNYQEEPVLEVHQNTPKTTKEIEIYEISKQYGPVKKGEHLWGIANKIRPNNIPVERMVKALKEANPKKIQNVDLIDVGIMLNVPEIKDGQFVVVEQDNLVPKELTEQPSVTDTKSIEPNDDIVLNDDSVNSNDDDLTINDDDDLSVGDDIDLILGDNSDTSVEELIDESLLVDGSDLEAVIKEEVDNDLQKMEDEQQAQQARLAIEQQIKDEEQLVDEVTKEQEMRLEEMKILKEKERLAQIESQRLESEANKRAEQSIPQKQGLIDLLFGRYVIVFVGIVGFIFAGIIGFIFYRRSDQDFEKGQKHDEERILIEKRAAAAAGTIHVPPSQTAGSHYSQELGGVETSTGNEDFERFHQEIDENTEAATELDFDLNSLQMMEDVEPVKKKPASATSDVEDHGLSVDADDSDNLDLSFDFKIDEDTIDEQREAVINAAEPETKTTEDAIPFDLEKLTTELTPSNVDLNVEPVAEVDLDAAMEKIQKETVENANQKHQEVEEDRSFSFDSVETNQSEEVVRDSDMPAGSSDPYESEKIKLELAEAYIDFDKELAEPLLKEVLEDGNDEQKVKAQELLDRIKN